MANQHDTFYELKNCTLLVAFVLDDVTMCILLFTGAPSQLRWGWGSPQIEKNKHKINLQQYFKNGVLPVLMLF
jgi:hypothetical protein